MTHLKFSSPARCDWEVQGIGEGTRRWKKCNEAMNTKPKYRKTDFCLAMRFVVAVHNNNNEIIFRSKRIMC